MVADGTIPAPTKICPCCKAEKLATAEFFYRHKSQRSGLTSRCKPCVRTDGAAWREGNRDLARACSREWAKNNPERDAANQKKWRERNPELVLACEREWRRKKPERVRAYWKKNRNPEKHRATMRVFNARHRERLRERRRIYRLENRERILARRRARREIEKHDPKFKVAKAISGGLLQALRHRKNGAHWESLVGYGREELVRHLERQFLRGMLWKNFGTAWHIDHILPVSSFAFTSKEDPEVRACWSLGNLRPLWKLDSLSKHAKRTHLI